MKEFSLVKNEANMFPEVADKYVVAFGFYRNAVAYLDYDGNADRDTPAETNGEWFALSRDFDSVMAWHGERRKKGVGEQVKIHWKKKK